MTSLGYIGAGGNVRRLPYDAEVEYLESTGTQYIDLGTIVPPDADFEFTGSIVSDMGNGCIFGETNTYSWGDGNPGYSLVTTPGGKVYMRYGDATSTALGLTTIGTGNTFTASLSGTSFQINGQSVATVARISSFVGTVSSMGVFRRKVIYNANQSTFSAVRINNLKFGNLFDLISVRVGTVGAIYDRRGVGGMNPDGSARTDGLYFNRGTGAFLYGNDL